jgi:hypothetical protein
MENLLNTLCKEWFGVKGLMISVYIKGEPRIFIGSTLSVFGEDSYSLTRKYGPTETRYYFTANDVLCVSAESE